MVNKFIISVLILLSCNMSVANASDIKANAYIITDASGITLASKNAKSIKSIASITKLMTAIVILEERLPDNELLQITIDDVDNIKHSSSRLSIGSLLYRDTMLKLALMSSENRAAHALARTSPGGVHSFVEKMNAQAKLLGMHDTRFVDPTGLSENNVSTASDLAKLVAAAAQYKKIKEYSTTKEYYVHDKKFINTNPLARGDNSWPLTISKTGFTQEAGRCVAMNTRIGNRETIMVILNSPTKESRTKDANRLKLYLSGNNNTKNNKKVSISKA